MAGEVLNLRLARKRKARSEREAQAAANRVVSGRAKAEKSVSVAEKDRAERVHVAHRRVTDEPTR